MKIQENTDSGKFSFYHFVSKMLDKLDIAYEKLIRWVLRHKTVTIVSMFALFFASLTLAKLIKTDFMPQNDQNYMSVYAKMQSGQRVEVTKKVALDIDSIIRAENPGNHVDQLVIR
ncbi:MAG: efflux RND transporter permease subunit [Butyricimonas faecihominis]